MTILYSHYFNCVYIVVNMMGKVDLIFILDSSTNVGDDNFNIMLQFVKDFLTYWANIDSGDVRVGIVTYSTNVTVEFQLNDLSTKTEIFDTIDQIPWRYGLTNMAEGIETMHNEMFTAANGDRPDVENIAIVMTNGVSNINWQRTIREAEKARDKGIDIYAIGIGLREEREVNAIASQPSENNAFFVDSFNQLESLAKNIYVFIRSGMYFF